MVPSLVSFAAGTLLAAALLGLLPEAIERSGSTSTFATVLAGLLAFFVLERLLIWRHCHEEAPCAVHGSTGHLILIGDALHNFVDGAVIAAAFVTSVPLGIAAGLAVITHELPQEVGDFAVLLDSGFTARRALIWNLWSGAATLPGAVAAYVALEYMEQIVAPILSLSATSFLYIGLADLLPGLPRRLGAQAGIVQFLLLLAGVGTIVGLKMLQE